MDFFLFHGRFWQGGRRFAPAMLSRGGRIWALGERRELALRAQGCAFIDCGGRTAIPGFYDPCLCPAAVGSPLPEGWEGLAQAVQTHLASHKRLAKQGGRLFWRSLDADPDAAALDAVWPHSPLVLEDFVRQRAWANSAALALLERRGLPRKLVCHVAFAEGRPTGRLSGPACGYLAGLLPDPDPHRLADLLQAGLTRCGRMGITGLRVLGPAAKQAGQLHLTATGPLPQTDLFGDSLFRPEELSQAQWQPGQQVIPCADGPALDRVLAHLARQSLPADNFRRMTLLGAGCTSPEQLRAMGKHKLGVITFPGWLERTLRDCMGQPGCRMDTCCAFRTLSGLGAHVAFAGLDAARPWDGIRKAVCREGKEGLTVEDALTAATAGAAWTAFREDVTGRLAPGFRADVQVLEADPFSLPPHMLHTIRPVLVLAAGRMLLREI